MALLQYAVCLVEGISHTDLASHGSSVPVMTLQPIRNCTRPDGTASKLDALRLR